MARVCCVESCKAVPHEDLTFFNFPIKQSLLKKWKDAIKPAEALTLDSVICSKHFASEDYETVRGRVRLKAKVVPTIFNDEESPKSSEESQKDPKENGHDSPNESDEESNDINEESNGINEESNEKIEESNEINEESHEINEKQEETKESEAKNSNCKDSSKSDDGESAEEQDLEEDGQDDDAEFEMPELLSCEVQLTEGDENETIECVPEAILHEDSDSHSEGDIHKEDIEDIIANYHIKQDPKLAERLKASLEKENVSNNQDKSEKECNKSEKVCNKSEKECNKSEKECNKSEKECNKSDKRDLPPDKDNDCVEVSYTPSKKRRKPEYIEIPVDKDATDKSNDCLMVMENVQVDIDPSMLLFGQDPEDGDSDVEETEVTETPGKDSKRKTDPISLLTSSDDDDVIIEEPHIDTVEVSDEDEDDIPLKKLIKEPVKRAKMTKVAKILWGKAGEHYCVKCRYTTTSKTDYIRHKEQHEKIFNVCEICDFSTASKGQFVRHKRSHKEERCFKCFKCDYKAKHHMSLIYHLKSHGVSEKEARESLKAKKSRCYNCKMYFTDYQNEYLNHVRECRVNKLSKCSKCKYTTKRPSDLKRHFMRKHKGPPPETEESEDEEFDDEE